MRSFASDNNSGVHPLVMDALLRANEDHALGYGSDKWTDEAVAMLKESFTPACESLFVFNGTGSNIVALQLMVRPFHSIICAETAHIYVDECGSPVKNTGAQIRPVLTPDGKLVITSYSIHYTKLYDGAIFEVKALDVQIGSITGGGRYDNLTGVFGMPGVSGVGISFGADRIFDVLNQLELYPKEAVNGTELLFVNFGEDEADYSLSVLTKVRAAGIRAEMYPDSAKMKKQMTYANAKNIPFVAIVGENEMKENKVLLKNMLSGEQTLLGSDELIAAIRP